MHAARDRSLQFKPLPDQDVDLWVCDGEVEMSSTEVLKAFPEILKPDVRVSISACTVTATCDRFPCPVNIMATSNPFQFVFEQFDLDCVRAVFSAGVMWVSMPFLEAVSTGVAVCSEDLRKPLPPLEVVPTAKRIARLRKYAQRGYAPPAGVIAWPDDEPLPPMPPGPKKWYEGTGTDLVLVSPRALKPIQDANNNNVDADTPESHENYMSELSNTTAVFYDKNTIVPKSRLRVAHLLPSRHKGIVRVEWRPTPKIYFQNCEAAIFEPHDPEEHRLDGYRLNIDVDPEFVEEIKTFITQRLLSCPPNRHPKTEISAYMPALSTLRWELPFTEYEMPTMQPENGDLPRIVTGYEQRIAFCTRVSGDVLRRSNNMPEEETIATRVKVRGNFCVCLFANTDLLSTYRRMPEDSKCHHISAMSVYARCEVLDALP